MASKGAYKRKLYIAKRDSEDSTQIDRITTRLHRAKVEMDNREVSVILESYNPVRQPRFIDEEKEYRRAIRNFEPTIWTKPKGMKRCSARDHWVKASSDYFSRKADAADGFHPICKDCRNAQARLNYATSLDREVRPYTRRDLRAA